MNAAVMQILIEAKNRASGDLNFLGDQVMGLNRGFGVAAKGAVVFGAALAAIEAGKAAFELGRAASQAIAISNSFETLATRVGASSAQMLASLQQVAGGTINNRDLMLSANRAMVAGVADSTGEMAQLLEIARNQARLFGLSTQQAFSDLILGLARGEAEIIDNLGIVVKAGEEYERYAASIGKAANELSSTERTAALTNAVLREGGKLLEENAGKGGEMADSFSRMDTSLANAKDALGALFTPAAAAVAEQLARAVDQVTAAMVSAARTPLEKTLDDQIVKMQGLERSAAALEGRLALAAPGTEQYNELNAALVEVNAELTSQRALVDALSNATGEANTANARLDQTLRAVAGSTADAGNAAADAAQKEDARRRIIDQLNDSLERTRRVQDLAAGASSALLSSFKSVVGEMGVDGAFSGYQVANDQLQKQIEIWDALELPPERVEFLIAQYTDRINDANRALTQTKTGLSDAEKAAQKLASETERAFESLKSNVAGVLQGALDPGVGVDPADFLPREDAINEDARRLADVAVNGFQSPWAGYLQGKFPELFSQAFDASGGDVQQAAARILRDFQDGLNPELIDKAAAKERIKRMLLGEATMAEIAQEIAQELSQEMGGQFSAADIQRAAAQALGVQSAEGDNGGDQFSESVIAGIRNNNVGAQVIEEIGSQIKAGFDALTEHGRSAGRVWGGGFLETVREGVPPSLIGILTDLVTPEVYARLRAQGSLTGAVN